MATCKSCGSHIQDNQGDSCSMCYGDVAHGNDNYYKEWGEQQEYEPENQQEEGE